ncbi:hypothetical protein [Streptomyces phaeofaciens]|nr:hypothetical protein [Streptomyces phaeofaciens]
MADTADTVEVAGTTAHLHAHPSTPHPSTPPTPHPSTRIGRPAPVSTAQPSDT